MAGDYRLDRLELDHERATDKEVHACLAGLMSFVEDPYPRLPLGRDLAQHELNRQRLLVHGLQKPRTEFPVNLERRADNSTRKLIEFTGRLR
jgi:hypothetical protein